jgi:hypothetical protein
MNRKALIIIGLQTVIIVVLFWVLVFYGKDEYEAYTQEETEEEIASESRVATENSATVINLSAEARKQSGIATTRLQAADYRGTLAAYGSVLSIDPLLELRTRYLAARAEADIVRASLAISRQEHQRLVQLNSDNRNVSDRAVAAAEAALKTEEAKLASAETAAASLRDTMRQQGGETLAAWFTEGGEPMQSLVQSRTMLVRVTLPSETATPDRNSLLTIEPPGAQGKAVKASFVSAAPQTDAVIQGKTWYYRAPADNLRAGMHVTVRSAGQGKAASGVVVPNPAVVWYAGKAWVYRKEGEDRFFRREINTENDAGDGWFVASGLEAGDELVTSGTQLLLSEEFKYQIKNENED